MAVIHYYESGTWKVPFFLYPKMWNGSEWVYVKPSIWGGDRWSTNVSVTLNPVDWANISGIADGTIYSNFNQIISGIGTTVSISANKPVSLNLYYSKNNGGMILYNNSITLENNDTLKWGISSTTPVDGTVSIINSFTNNVLDTFTCNLVSQAEGPSLPPPPPPPVLRPGSPRERFDSQLV